MFARFFWQTLHRSDESASWRWALSVALPLGFMAVLGTVMSAIVLGGGLVAWVYWVLDRRRFAFSRRDATVAFIFCAYVGITALFAVIHPNPLAGLDVTINNVTFLLTLALLPVLRDFFRSYWTGWVLKALWAGGIACGVGAAAESVFYNVPRAELLAGNPLVFAYLAGVLTLFNLLLAFESQKNAGRLLHGVAAALSLWGLLLTGSRGPIVIVIALVALLLCLEALRYIRRHRYRGAAQIAGIAVVAAMAVTGLQLAGTFAKVEQRFDQLVTSLNDPSPAGDKSVALRLAMLRSGFHAFLEHPFIGYGRQNAVAAANDQFSDDPEFRVTHLHNSFITEAVASGVLGLLAYCAVLATPVIAAVGLSGAHRRAALVFALFTGAYAAVNIGFYHDIFTAYFCLVVSALAALPRTGRDAPAYAMNETTPATAKGDAAGKTEQSPG